MQDKTFKVRRAFLIPLWIIIFLFFVLVVVTIIGGRRWEATTAAVLFAIMLFIGIEAQSRKITVDNEKVTIKKFFRTKAFMWAQINHLGMVELGNKVYFLLSRPRGFNFFSNMMENHAALVALLAEKIDAERVEQEIRDYLSRPVERLSIIVMEYVAALVLVGIIVVKLLPG